MCLHCVAGTREGARMAAKDDASLASNIRRVMDVRGVSMRELCRTCGGTNRATVYRVVSGSIRESRVDTILDICRALDVDPDELLGTMPLPLEPDVQQLYEHASSLADRDKWFVVDLVRSLRRRSREDQDGRE